MKFKELLMHQVITVTLLMGIVLGTIIGVLMREINSNRYSKRVIMYVKFPAEIYLHMVKAFSMPLIASCITLSIGSMPQQVLKRIGWHYVIYVCLTSLESSILAACFGLLFRSGKGIKASVVQGSKTDYAMTLTDSILDVFRNIFPQNVLEVTFRRRITKLVNTNNDTFENLHKWEVEKEGTTLREFNMWGLICVSVITGLTLNILDERGQYVLSLVKSFVKATTVISLWLMWYAPIGVTFLIAAEIMRMGETSIFSRNTGMFTVSVLTMLTIQVVVYLLIYCVIVRKNPFKFLYNISEAIVTAISTGSSNAALPIAIICMRDKNLVDKRIVDFVMPIGVTVNKNGTTIWIILAVLFVKDINNMSMGIIELCSIVIFSIIIGMSTPGFPEASYHGMVFLLVSRGIPDNDAGILLTIDWFLGRCRTVVNVCGDSIAAAVIEHMNRHLLEDIPDIDVT